MMPHRQQSEHPSRKRAMNGHRRPDNALPMFHSTPCADSVIPCGQKVGGDRLPRRVKVLQQFFGRGAKDVPTQHTLSPRIHVTFSPLSRVRHSIRAANAGVVTKRTPAGTWAWRQRSGSLVQLLGRDRSRSSNMCPRCVVYVKKTPSWQFSMRPAVPLSCC